MKSKTITILFITSIVCNLLLIGFLIGSYTNTKNRFSSPIQTAPPWIKWVPEQQRERIKQGFMGRRNEMRKLKGEMEKHHQLVIEAITEKDFSAAKLNQLLLEQRERVLQLQQKGDERLVTRISALSLKERQKFSERMRPRSSPRPPNDRPPRYGNIPQVFN